MKERKIEEIMGGMDCPRDFEPCKSGTEAPCKSRLLADGAVVDCTEAECLNEVNCKYRMAFGFGHLCNCPVRSYIARELRK